MRSPYTRRERSANSSPIRANSSLVLSLGVERRSRLVQDHQRRVPEERTRQRQPLPLPGRQIRPVDERRPEQRLVPPGNAPMSRSAPARSAARTIAAKIS